MGKLFLHEAIAVALLGFSDRTASFEQICETFAKRDLYRKKNGHYPDCTQIRARVNKNLQWFNKRLPGAVQLKQ